jgi:Holliday junction resolvase RusA-like endonuclease
MRERMMDFFVPGTPRPQGSAKWIPSGTTGRSIPIKNPNLETWRSCVAIFAQQGIAKFSFKRVDYAALGLSLTFVFERPKSHYRTGRNAHLLKTIAPLRHFQKPDIDKIERAILDSLTGIVYKDDCQVDHVVKTKGWGPRAGVHIIVRGEVDVRT